MDPNGNGFVEKAEFEDYLNNNNLALGVERTSQLYETIKDATKSLDSDAEDVGITFQDLIKYFENEQVNEGTYDKIAPVQINIRSIDDMEKYFAAANMLGTNLCQDSLTVMGQGLQDNKVDDAMKILLAKGSALPESLEEQEVERWKPFAAFKRRVDRRTVMSSPKGIIRDLLPGAYNSNNLADYSDLPPIEPQKTVVHGVQWIEGQEGEKDGQKYWIKPSRLIFPTSFNGHVETDVG